MKDIFRIKERGSTLSREIIGGLVVFISMIYVIPLTANILTNTGMDYKTVFIATAVASGIATIVMGLIANYPAALSAGMGYNTFFAYTICGGMGFSWQEALTICLISSIIFFILTLFKIRGKLFNAIPKDIKSAIIVGLGCFIAFVGIKNSGLVEISNNQLKLGDLSDPQTILSLFGIIVMLIFLNMKGKVQNFAVVIAIALTAVVGVTCGQIFPELKDVMPSFSNEMIITSGNNININNNFINLNCLANPKTYVIIFSIVFVHIFDSSPVLYALGKEINDIDENNRLKSEQKVLSCDAFGCVISSLSGTSPVTTFAESTISAKIGARTGLCAVVCGSLFLLSILMYPLLTVFNHPSVTAMALICVGGMLFSELKNINWDDKIIVMTTFLIIILMVLTYSIVDGIGLGIIFYSLMMLASKRGKEVSKLVYIIACLFVISYVLNIIMTLI